MRAYAVVLVAVVLALGAVAGWGYPSLNGASGLVSLPTAETTPAGMVDLAVDYQKVGDTRIWPMRATLGVGENAEVWFGYTRISANEEAAGEEVEGFGISPMMRTGGIVIIGGGDSGGTGIDRAWNVGGKYLLPSKSESGVKLAVGGSTGKLENGEDLELSTAFFVASQKISLKPGRLPLETKAHLGLLWAKVGSPIDNTTLEPFAGLEFIEKKGASLGLEYRLKDNDLDEKAPFSAVVRYPLGGVERPVMLEVGFTNAAVAGLGGADSRVFVGLGYRLGTMKGTGEPGTRTRPWGY